MINLNNRHGPVRRVQKPEESGVQCGSGGKPRDGSAEWIQKVFVIHCRDGDPYRPRDGTIKGCCTIRPRDSIWINPRDRIGINPRDGSDSRPRDGTFGPPGLCRKRRKTPGKDRPRVPERERYALKCLKICELFIKLN